MRFIGIQRQVIGVFLTFALLLIAVAPPRARAQFGGMKKRIMQVAVCGGGAYGGYKLGEKVAEIEAKKLKLGAEEAAKHRRAFQIGMALALCGGGALIAGTIYDKLSKRDLEARQKEIDAAVADAAPGTRTYVLPDSQLQGKIQTEPIVTEGNKECRTTVDNLADSGEPAMAKYCRTPPNGKFELQV